ncbi:MAG: hypothetical protein NBV60_02625 [Erythrobacter sp.]|nr:hypothetical protein [Erythrobacter sp.]
MVMLRGAGAFLCLMGLIWTLQGLGLLNWPANSFMIAQSQWVLYGALTAMLGAVLLLIAEWRRRR